MKNKPTKPGGRLATSSPPLWVWGCVAMLVLLLFAVTFPEYSKYLQIDERELLSANRVRIDDFFDDASGKSPVVPRVVAVGTSLLHRGTYLDSAMMQVAEGQPPFRFLRVAAIRAKYNHYLRLAEDLIERHPDLLVLQVDICYGRGIGLGYSELLQERFKVILKKAARKMKFKKLARKINTKRLKVAGKKVINRVEDVFDRRAQGLNPAALMKFDRFAAVLQSQKLQVSTNIDNVYRLLEQASEQRVKVAFLVMPRSPKAEEVKDKVLRPLENAFLSDLQERYGVAVLRCPLDFSQEEFFDYGHFKEAGRKRFSRWFVTATRNLLASDDML